MAKRKKTLVKNTQLGFGKKNLETELRRAGTLFVEGEWASVCEVLVPLSQQHPQNKRVWEYLVGASFELGNLRLCQKAGMNLLAIDPDDSDEAYGLAEVYFRNKHPMLALETFRRALQISPNHDFAAEAREWVSRLEPIVDGLLQDLGLRSAEGLATATLHELGQAYLEQGDYELARRTEEEVLEKHPEFLSSRNNLSLICWVQKDPEGAIATAQTVLDLDPTNIHALSNLVQFEVRLGNAEAAEKYGEQLKAVQNDAWEGWTKKIEGLSYLGDDQGVVEIFEQALDQDGQALPTTALFYHWSAVALARTGDRKRAIAQWERALELDPSLEIAQDNLSDIQRSVGQRHGAWPFIWEYWLMPQATEKMWDILNTNLKSVKSNPLESALKTFLEHHPVVLSILPRILERGGPAGQEFVLSVAEQLKTPELLSMMSEFALSQHGSDLMRNRAAALAVGAKLLPSNLTLWVNGEWRELLLLAYEFHDNPIMQHSQQVGQYLDQALLLLRKGGKSRAESAERLLVQALDLEPDAPDLLNNLASAYLYQNREVEGYSLIRELANRFPDYIFACAGAAKLYIKAGDLETAENLLRPFLSRERFHYLEFNAFCEAYVELLVAQKQRDGARGWLNLWERATPNSPGLEYWKHRLSKKILEFPKL